MSGSLSSLGAYCLLLNSFYTYPRYGFPYPFDSYLFWGMLLILLITATLSCTVSHYLIDLIELVEREKKEVLIPSAPSTQSSSDIPCLIKAATLQSWYGRTIHSLSLYFCLTALVFWGLNIVNQLTALFGIIAQARLYAIGAVAVLLTFLNLFEFPQLQYMHIALAGCRVAYFIVWGVDIIPTRHFSSHLIVPLLVCVFAYQIPLPGIMRFYPRSVSARKYLQVAVLLSYIAMYMFSGLAKPFTYNTSINVTVYLLLLVSNISSGHIYWKTFAQIILSWRYGTALSAEREAHPLKCRLIEITLHWPVFGIYVISHLLEATLYPFFYPNVFLLWLPIFILNINWILLIGYKQKLIAVKRIAAKITERLQVLFGILSVTGSISSVYVLVTWWNMRIWFLFPAFCAVAMLVVLVWSRFIDRRVR